MKNLFVPNSLRAFLLLFIAASGLACKKENRCDCFKKTGDIVTEERQPGAFRNVYVEHNVNLIFVEDTARFVVAEAGEKLLKLIKTEADGEWLRIRNDNKCNFVRRYDIPVNVYVHYTPDMLFHIKTKGTGTITNSNPCTADSVDLEVESSGDINFLMGSGKVLTHQHGAGDVTIRGNADEIAIFSRGTGFTITDECVTPYTWVSTNTTGKVTVAPSFQLICEILGPGNVYYKGQPTNISNRETSTGKLLPLE